MKAIVSLLVVGASLVATARVEATPRSLEYYKLRKEYVRLQNKASVLYKGIAHWRNVASNRNVMIVPGGFLGPHQTRPAAVDANAAVQRISQLYYQARAGGRNVSLTRAVKYYLNFSNQMKRKIHGTEIAPRERELARVHRQFRAVQQRLQALQHPTRPQTGHGPSGNLTHGTGGNLSNLYWQQGGRRSR